MDQALLEPKAVSCCRQTVAEGLWVTEGSFPYRQVLQETNTSNTDCLGHACTGVFPQSNFRHLTLVIMGLKAPVGSVGHL